MLAAGRIHLNARTAAAGLAALAALAVGLGTAGATIGRSQARPPVGVVLSEWKVVPSSSSVPAGKVTFRVANRGTMEHEFVVLRTDRHHHVLPVKAAVAAETGRQGEISSIAPGKVRSLTLTLKPGKYVLICNLLGHYKAGQYAALRVR